MASGQQQYRKHPEYSMPAATPMDQLMQGPLVAWVRTFKDDDENRTELDYSQLIDGAFLDNVFSRLDPRTNGRAHIQPAEDVYTRIRNFDSLVRAVKGFYEDVLGQFVLVRLPDPVTLGRDPDSETGLAGMQTLLLLVLGCAVQGPSKESVIEDIKRLPLATQHDIVNCIQQVADNPACVWNKDWTEWESIESCHGTWADKEEQQQHREELFRILVQHLRRLVQERDDYANQFTNVVLRELSNSNNANSMSSIQRHSNASPQSGVVVELAEAKAKIRRWRQELEEKCEQVAELRDELDALKMHSVKIKQENMDLVQEARLSKALRDELDIVRERASKVDRLEAELNRYKDKLNDIDYYKARLDELREDNRLLEETKVILEGQLESARQRAELVLDLEGELLKCKSQLTNLLVEKEADKERLKKLAEENAHWQLCTKNCLSESASLTAELESLRAHQASADASKDQFTNLGEQMSSVDLLGKARRLEMENQRLTNLLSSTNAKESGVRGDNGEKILQLEGECTRLKLRLVDLEEERRTKESHVAEMMAAVTLRAAEVEKQHQDLHRNHQEQQNLIENLKVERCKIEELELQVSSLGAENQKLQRSADLFQRRVDSVQNESRDLESENTKLHKTVESLRHSLRRLNDLEKENTDLESENHRLDRESKGLHKEIVRLKQAIEIKDASLDEFSSKLSTAEREWKRLAKEVSALQAQGCKLRELERDNKELQQSSIVEHKTLVAIREELVQEKIRCQQLQCQLDTNWRTLEIGRVERETLKSANEELTQCCVAAASLELAANKSEAAGYAQQQESLPPTLELGREVLAVKDRLVELERQNAVLLAEKDNLTAQICSQRERVNESGAQLAALSQQLATLQVENSTLASQLDSTTTQNSGIQAALAAVESEREKLAAQLQSSDSRLERVSRDQQELQTLHEQLQSEYDALLAEREQLKICQRESKTELRALHDQLATSVVAEQEWQRSRTELQEELDKSRAETRSLTNLRAEHSRLKDDFRSLFVANEKLKSEYKCLQNDYKSLRGEHNTLKLKHTQLQGEAAESRHQVTNLDVELSKLNNKCDVLQQWNTTLEEDKRNLVNQVSVLLAQYHELFSQTLEEKDHFHEETKNFSDKFNYLKRQKEILEDKIMEQYRRMENCPSGGSGSPFKKNAKASIGALFVRKMRRASSELISRVPRSRSRNRVGDGLVSGDRESPDQHDGQMDTFSLESGSHSGSNSGCGSLDGGSGGEGDVTPTSLTGSVGGASTDLPPGSGRSWNDRDRNRQSLPVIHYQHSDLGNCAPTSAGSVRHSVSPDGMCDGSPTTNSSSQINGNPLLPSLPAMNGNSDDVELECNTHNSAATNTPHAKGSLSGSLMSAAPLMMMTPCSPHVQQPSPRVDGVASGFHHVSCAPNSAKNTVPVGALQRFAQPSRSLALLERAGSRQPLCLSEVDPSLVLSDSASPLALPLASRSSPLMTPRNVSPSGSDLLPMVSNVTSSMSNNKNHNNNNQINSSSSSRSGTPATLVQTSTTGISPTPLDTSTPNPKLFPHLTSTTRINVNISTAAITPLTSSPSPSSPLLPGPLERRGSLRLPPRPSPRISSSEGPPLPARVTNQDKPALPPRLYTNSTAPAVEEKPAEDTNINGSTTGAGSASSIWYEYGCV
uniref:Girdin n=3 Tax=Daphnia magna TaxID=35525 RepID=A0A0P4Y8S8_9CRUS